MKERKDPEWALANRLIDDLLAAGFAITVNDGEQEPVVQSKDKAAILEAMASTDEDYLHVIRSGKEKDNFVAGWVRMIYGNGVDIISDYTTNLQPIMAGVDALYAELQEV
jgi:hypothetical protein